MIIIQTRIRYNSNNSKSKDNRIPNYASYIKPIILQSIISSSAKCDSSISIYRQKNNLLYVCNVWCMNQELVLFCAHKSIQTNKQTWVYQISKTFCFENHSGCYFYLLVHYEVRRSAISRSKRGNQTCKPDGHQT